MTIQRCRTCGAHQHHPRPFCLSCKGSDLELVEISGGGSVWSFTEVHRSPREGREAPYTVALVRLDEGPVVLTHLTHDDPACDQRVRASTDDQGLVVFSRET